MEGQRERRLSWPPRIPTEIRNSAVESYLAEVAGSYRLSRASSRKSASYKGFSERKPPPGLSPTPSTGREREPGDNGGFSRGKKPRTPTPPHSVRRSVSTDQISSGDSVESSSPVPVAATLEKRGQHERRRGWSPSARGGSRSPSPSMTRPVFASPSLQRTVAGGDNYGNSENSKIFYEYLSYYSSRQASPARSGTTEMVDDILSPPGDGEDVFVPPVPSIASNNDGNTPTTTTTTTTTNTNISTGDYTNTNTSTSINKSSSASAEEIKMEGTGSNESDGEKARAAGAAARAARAAAAIAERWAKEARLRLEELRKRPGNSRCADCGAPCADWASVAHASFVCFACAGKHRSLGMHVTFTRSLTMEKWKEGDLRIMEAGGNNQLAEFVSRVGLYPWCTTRDKYSHPCLPLYRKHLVALAGGQQPPPIPREALEKAVLVASGEGSSEYDSSSNGDGSSSRSRSSSLDSDEEDENTGDQLKTLIKNVSGGCGGLGHALRKWSCQLPLARQTRGLGDGESGAGARAEGSAGAVAMAGGGLAPRWIPDDEKEACMLCERKFTLVLRRHHCRRCGRLSCDFCAPKDNTRPIVEWGFPQAVRHCRLCYRSPLLEWPDRASD